MKQIGKWCSKFLVSWKSVYLVEYPELKIKLRLNQSRTTFSRLKEEEVPELQQFHDRYCVEWSSMFSREDAERRLAQGDRCYIARRNGEMAGFLWIATGQTYSPDLGCTFRVKDRCVVIYNAFVRADQRARAVGPGVLAFGFADLDREGYQKCLAYVRTSNAKVLGPSQRGFKATIAGKITYGYFLGFHMVFKRISKPLEMEIIHTDGGWGKWKYLFGKKYRSRMLKVAEGA